MGGGSQGLQDLLVDGVGQRQGLVQQGLALLAVLVGKGLVLDTADKKTLPILIAQLRSADFLKFDMGKVYMMVAIAILPVIIVYLLLSKFIVRGVALGGVKG